jgi:hypothetical protein
LTNITIFDLTDEEKTKLMNEHAEKLIELDIYKNTPVQEMWLKELHEFEKMYDKWLDTQTSDGKKPAKKTAAKGKKIAIKTK